jgi:hypothetical protein
MALQDPAISYFFFCRAPIVLTNGRAFDAGDAVFFTGAQKPWWGSAPQCDGYKKVCLSVGYAPNGTLDDVSMLADVQFGGMPALDAVVCFANLNELTTPLPPGTAWLDAGADDVAWQPQRPQLPQPARGRERHPDRAQSRHGSHPQRPEQPMPRSLV